MTITYHLICKIKVSLHLCNLVLYASNRTLYYKIYLRMLDSMKERNYFKFASFKDVNGSLSFLINFCLF